MESPCNLYFQNKYLHKRKCVCCYKRILAELRASIETALIFMLVWNRVHGGLAHRPRFPGSFAPKLWGLCLGPSFVVHWAGAWLSCDGLSGFSLPYIMGVTGCPGPGAFLVCSWSLERVPFPHHYTQFIWSLWHIIDTHTYAQAFIHSHAHPTITTWLLGFDNNH